MRCLSTLLAISLSLGFAACMTPAPVQQPAPVKTEVAAIVSATPPPKQTPPPAPASVVLSWEKNHPERAAWTKALFGELDAHYDSFIKAQDSLFFYPGFQKLTREQKIHVWAEMIVWTTYFECAWNPSDASVDVGVQGDKDTYSVGLLQLSVVDQPNYGLKFGYSFSDLQDPIKNLHLGIGIMSKQIDKHGKILIPTGEKGVYWSTLHPGGAHDRSSSIAAHTKALSL
jgi:hypothetical protein